MRLQQKHPKVTQYTKQKRTILIRSKSDENVISYNVGPKEMDCYTISSMMKCVKICSGRLFFDNRTKRGKRHMDVYVICTAENLRNRVCIGAAC